MWHHVVATLLDGGSCPSLQRALDSTEASAYGAAMVLYVDGFAYPIGFGTEFAGPTTSARNLVGVKTGLTGWLSADIDDIAIYEEALTEDDVAAHLAISDAPEADPLLLFPADRTDTDHDGVADSQDNCESAANPSQADEDLDGVGDACDGPPDRDSDEVPDSSDNCPGVYNPDQADSDSDGTGDACE